jgi:hypothetical protein
MAANDKDRLGDKLHDVEKAREDIYFAERDRELMEKLRLHGVEVEECPGCHGMWLDQGEAEKIGRRETEGWIARWLRLEFPKST